MDSTPIKPTVSSAARSKLRPSVSADADGLSSATPAKAVQEHPRAGRGRRLVFSVADLKKVAEERRGERVRAAEEARSDVKERAPPVAVKKKSGKDVVPEKFEPLSKCFDCLQSSLRLIQMKKTRPTFANISKSVESLLERRFTYAHLAQLKYVLRDLMDVEKVVVYDESTLCMKPELRISLVFDGCGKEGKGKETKFMNMRKEFRARLADFVKAHLSADQVPEGQLPEPFNQTISCTTTAVELPPAVEEPASYSPPLMSSHLTPSFQRKFSKKASLVKTTAIPDVFPSAILKSPETAASLSYQTLLYGPDKSSSSLVSEKEPVIDLKASPAYSKKNDQEKLRSACTPFRASAATLTPSSDTPDLRSPKRPSPCKDESPCKTVRHTTRVRSLQFQSPIKSVEEYGKRERSKSVTDEDILKFLPTSLVQSVKEKEEKAQEERDNGITELRRRKKMIACLPKLFDMIYLVFQSANKTLMTKQELVHKIVSCHIDIVDSSEVEEQLSLLLQILPDWISEKKISSGDLVVCVGKLSAPEAIHARLAEAK